MKSFVLSYESCGREYKEIIKETKKNQRTMGKLLVW